MIYFIHSRTIIPIERSDTRQISQLNHLFANHVNRSFFAFLVRSNSLPSLHPTETKKAKNTTNHFNLLEQFSPLSVDSILWLITANWMTDWLMEIVQKSFWNAIKVRRSFSVRFSFPLKAWHGRWFWFPLFVCYPDGMCFLARPRVLIYSSAAFQSRLVNHNLLSASI